jgi:TolB protein
VGRRFTIPVIALAAVVAASCSGAATNSPSAADSRATPSAPPVAPRAAYKGWIAFDDRRAIWVMKADGSGRRQLTQPGAGNDFDPSWSPDGKRIVFRTSRGRYKPDPGGIGAEGIFVIDVATRKERQIQPPQGGLFPAWSPDGKTIAFSGTRGNPHEDGILLMNPDGTNVRDLGLPTGGNECATWSPDSSKLAFCHHGGDGNWAVWTVNADGSDPRQLTHPTLTLPRGSGGDSPGPWSPDGKRLAFGSQRSGNFDVFVMNADGSGQHQLTHAADGGSPAAWLPDGRIVYASFHGNQPLPSWYLMRADGTGVRSLPQLDGAGDPMDWLATAA